jgi:outer membrane receptor for ferrienterochelin and colicins
MLVCTCALHARAEEPVIDVVVTGTRSEESSRQAAVATEVITRKRIEESGARNVAELLHTVPGLQVSESGARGGTELWLRGLGSEYTLVLFDGERLPGRVDGALDLTRYGVEAIDRVEVVRGPSSALYGSDAIAGVVNILGRESRRPLEADGMLSLGQNGTRDGTAFVAGRPLDRLRLAAYGGYHGFDAVQGRGGEGTRSSKRVQGSAGGDGTWEPSAAHRLRFGGDYVSTDLTGVDDGAGSAVFDRFQRQHQGLGRVSHRFERGPVRVESHASYSRYQAELLLDQRGATALDKYERSHEDLSQASVIAHADLARGQRLSVGTDGLVQLLTSPRLSARGERVRVAPFVQYDVRVWERGARSLRLVPGLRYDWDSEFGSAVSPKLAVRLDPHAQVVVRASYGRGFRAPSFQELLLRFENPSAGYVVEGNPALGAERSHGADLSVEYTPHEVVTLGGALFRNDLSHMITAVSVDDGGREGSLFSYSNIRAAWTMGLESSLMVRVRPYLTLSAGYAYTRTRDRDADRSLEARARHRPAFTAKLAYPRLGPALVVRGAVEIGRVLFEDDDGDGRDTRVVAPALTRLDARLQQELFHHVELFVGVDNAVGTLDAYAINKPRTVYAGARGRY